VDGQVGKVWRPVRQIDDPYWFSGIPGVRREIRYVLRRVYYRAWYALAEFVDNSLQSFLAHREELAKLHGADYKLEVAINISPSEDGGRIVCSTKFRVCSND
jgi:hypothetical protein